MEAVLIFIRISGLIFAMPILGDQPVPIKARVLLAAAMAYAAAPMVEGRFLLGVPQDLTVLALMVSKELLVGLLLGYLTRVAFSGILMGASIVAYQMGFGTANLVLPDFDVNADAFSAFHRTFVMLIFLTLDLHHIFFRALFHSFELIPAGGASFNGDIADLLIKVTGGLVGVAMQLAAPLLVALMLTMAALGLVSRAVPQLNVFTVSFPISFTVGLLIYIATLIYYPQWMNGHFQSAEAHMWRVVGSLARK